VNESFLLILFAWLISHQPTVLFSQNKPATSNQPTVLFSQNKPAPAISHQPTEQALVATKSATGICYQFVSEENKCVHSFWSCALLSVLF
jgi:hypothetical protein